MSATLRPLSTGQLLDRAVECYRRDAFLFMGIALPMLALLAAVQILTQDLGIKPQLTPPGQLPHLSAGYWLGFSTALAIGLVVGAYVAGASAWAASRVDMGEEAGIARAYREINGRVVSVVGAYLLAAICGVAPIAIGLFAFFLVVPFSPLLAAMSSLLILAGFAASVWIFLRLVLVIPVAALERCGVVAALRRSAALTKGVLGRALLVIVGAVCLYFAITFVFSLVALIIYYVTSHSVRDLQLASFVGNCISLLVVTPLVTIDFALFYLDCKVRKEGFDVELLLRRNQTPAAPDAAAL